MEKLMEMVDATTLEKSYLFPATPCDESMCKNFLSAQFVSDSQQVYSQRFKIGKITYYVHLALADSDSKISNGDPEVELSSKVLDTLLDIEPLFRLDGRVVCGEELKSGKYYMMACSLSVPDRWDSYARDVAAYSNKLYAERPHDFELIIVLKFRHNDGWEKHANLLDFFKLFHSSCIVIHLDVPLEESFKLHALNSDEALLIDPKGSVLLHKHLEFLREFPSMAFPFTDTSALWADYWSLKPTSLARFLNLKPSDKVFRKLPGTDPLQEEHRCISEFQSNKIVFLYLYCVGDQLAFLRNTVISMRNKGKEFEILTAYVPSSNYLNSEQFLKVFSDLVALRGLSWWVVPYDSSMYARLRPLYAKYSDQLIVFDPEIKDGEPHGLEIMSLYGECMFPFTKTLVIEHVLKELSLVDLQFFFESVTELYKEGRDDPGEVNSVLKGKNVLVYFDSYYSNPTPVYRPFVSWYHSLEEEKKSNFEVVFVSLNPHQPNDDLRCLFPSWLVFPKDEVGLAKHVVDNFFLRLFKHVFSTIVAFGRDGKIRSLRAHSVLSSSEARVSFPFNGDLQGEVFTIFNDYLEELLVSGPGS